MKLEDVHWYYIDENNNDAQVGPFTIRDFKEKYLAGVFTPESYCWHEEIDDWDKLKNIYFRNKPALFYFTEAPPIIISQDISNTPTIVIEHPENSISPSPENKEMSIAEEIRKRLRERFAK